jgi:hypothetical protein
MTTMTRSYQGLGLLVQLNADRLLYVAVIAVALMAGAGLGALIG